LDFSCASKIRFLANRTAQGPSGGYVFIQKQSGRLFSRALNFSRRSTGRIAAMLIGRASLNNNATIAQRATAAQIGNCRFSGVNC
jgi:hypothetical protein